MRELDGVMFAGRPNINMKCRALLFDKFQIWRYCGSQEHERTEEFEAEIDFLKERGVVAAPALEASDFDDVSLSVVEEYTKTISPYLETKNSMSVSSGPLVRDSGTRAIAAKIRQQSDSDVVPICENELPTQLLDTLCRSVMGDVVTVAIDHLPVPDDSCEWQDIIDFRAEKRNQLWDFRRILHTLATKKQSEAEIRDDIDWSLHEYSKEMERFKLKRSVSFVETYLIPTVEAIEGLKPSAFLKGLISVRKRRIELLEGEAKASGRECAYLFEAQKQFDRSR